MDVSGHVKLKLEVWGIKRRDAKSVTSEVGFRSQT